MREFKNQVAVKVCGVTVAGDALACAAAGVEMIGLNFSSASVRCISLPRGAEIIAAVRREFPQIKFVGVFLDQDLELVQKHVRDLALDAVQLHGDERPEYVRAVASSAIPATTLVIKALRISDASSAAKAAAYQCDSILFDTWSAAAPGGTGQTFPWSVAAVLRPEGQRLILAGGLTSENVAEAIRAVRPFAVDVCSGVEASPGRKDPARVHRFVGAVRNVDGGEAAE